MRRCSSSRAAAVRVGCVRTQPEARALESEGAQEVEAEAAEGAEAGAAAVAAARPPPA